MKASLATGIALGALADAAFGDPRRWHPVAGFGQVALAAERRLYRDDRAAGAVFTALLVGVPTLLARRVRGPLPTALVVWSALGGRSLVREALATSQADLHAARRRIRALVSRDPASLDEKGVLRACVESLAENASDAVVAPLFWAAVAGPAGVVAHRTANTLDAMVGYRTARYERFGWAAARLDDALNWAPARLTAALTALVSGRPRDTLAVARRDGDLHASPNAGLTEAAFAGALGVRLGDDEVTRHGVPVRRPPVGDGPPPAREDVVRAARLTRLVGAAAAVLAVAVAAGRGR